MIALPLTPELAQSLGLHPKGRRWGPCPACNAPRTSSSDPRPPLILPGKGWTCYACHAQGDAINLVSYALLGRRDAGHEFPAVLAWLTERGFLAPDAALPRSRLTPRPQRASTGQPDPSAPRHRPPHSEVGAILRRCRKPHEDADTRAFLASRKLPIDVPAGVLPPTFSAPWWPSPWSTLWPLVIPAYEADGTLASMHGRAVHPVAKDGETGPPRKTTWPAGCEAIGLLFADPVLARPLLRGLGAPGSKVLIVEGLTDYLAASALLRGRYGVLGIASGSAPALGLVRWPERTTLLIATDNDTAGERYAAAIVEACWMVTCKRVPLHLMEAA